MTLSWNIQPVESRPLSTLPYDPHVATLLRIINKMCQCCLSRQSELDGRTANTKVSFIVRNVAFQILATNWLKSMVVCLISVHSAIQRAEDKNKVRLSSVLSIRESWTDSKLCPAMRHSGFSHTLKVTSILLSAAIKARGVWTLCTKRKFLTFFQHYNTKATRWKMFTLFIYNPLFWCDGLNKCVQTAQQSFLFCSIS